jgi:hypothetical protein
MANEIVKKIRSAGYYETSISPGRFNAARLALADLLQIIQRSQVTVRGREFPRIDGTNQRVPDRADSISQQIEKFHHLEAWRFFRSGQFTDLRAMQTDWLDQLPGGPPFANWESGKYVYVEHVLIAFSDLFNLAARLAESAAGDELMNVEVKVGGLKGRFLTVADQINHLDRIGGSERALMNDHAATYVCSRSQLFAESGQLAIKASQDLFGVFAKEVSATLLQEWLASVN